MSACDISSVRNDETNIKETHMKQWIAAHILSTEDLLMEETLPITNKELISSLSLVISALALFGIIIHLLG
jgi:hypothetical protein